MGVFNSGCGSFYDDDRDRASLGVGSYFWKLSVDFVFLIFLKIL